MMFINLNDNFHEKKVCLSCLLSDGHTSLCDTLASYNISIRHCNSIYRSEKMEMCNSSPLRTVTWSARSVCIDRTLQSCLYIKHLSFCNKVVYALVSADAHRLHHVSGLAWADEHTLVTTSHDATIKQWTITYWAASKHPSPGTRTTVDFSLSFFFFKLYFHCLNSVLCCLVTSEL